MELGKFSISLAVKNIAASRAFYEKLTFEVLDGNQEDGGCGYFAFLPQAATVRRVS